MQKSFSKLFLQIFFLSNLIEILNKSLNGIFLSDIKILAKIFGIIVKKDGNIMEELEAIGVSELEPLLGVFSTAAVKIGISYANLSEEKVLTKIESGCLLKKNSDYIPCAKFLKGSKCESERFQ